MQTQTNINQSGCETRGSGAQLTVAPQAVIENTVVTDITDDFLWMEKARWLTAEAYAALADPKLNLQAEDVFELISKDHYEEQGLAKTIAALTTDPGTGVTTITGLVRVVVGARDNGAKGAPIDAMHFINPLLGWPHENAGFTGSHVAELGRFMIVSQCRTPEMRRCGVAAALTRRLYDKGVELMRSANAAILYAIMPTYMTRLIHQAGIRIREIQSSLKIEDPFAARVFEEFSLYWKRSSPRLYEWPDAPIAAQ